MKTVKPRKQAAPVRFSPKTARRGVAPRPIGFRSVLVPVDFSKHSLQVIEFAHSLLERFGGDLHLLHVFETDYPFVNMAAMPLIVPELEVGRRVRRHLKEVARKCGVELSRERIHSRKGRPFVEICRLARECGNDLIVLATRGNTGLKHLALGSTVERVIRYSPCPVLVLHDRQEKSGGNAGPNGKSHSALGFQRILVPIDFSNCSLKALAYAKTLARQFKARLVLLNSVAIQYYVASDEYARYDLPLLMQQSEKAAREHMRDLVQKTDWDGVEVESLLEIGHAGEQICSHALDEGADLIVTATHGRTGLRHILIGSTAEYVVRHAHCPVLVIPSHERPALPSE